MKPLAFIGALTLASAMTGCTPTLDWRDVRPAGSGLQALFPCKPAVEARRLALAGVAVEMTLYACTAGGSTFAVGIADVGEPQRVDPALAQLWAAAAHNIASSGSHAVAPLKVQGMSSQAQAGRQAFAGRLSDGQSVEEQVAVFARGTRVFQATMVGPKLDVEAVETFFGALHLSE